MNLKSKKRLRASFFAKVGTNAATFCAMFDTAPALCFYMKDLEGRIMAINRRNCDVCNIKSEWDAIGLRSDQLFPEPYASAYMALDREVIETGKPVIGRITPHPADKSHNFMISNVYPLKDAAGQVVGTARAYLLTSGDNAEDAHYGKLRPAISYMEQHFTENVGLDVLAALCGISVSTFRRTFLAAFHRSPGHYLTDLRLKAAMRQLTTSNRLISEIALSTGFFDQSHLTRVFVRERHMTPGEFRRRHRT